MNAVAAEHPAVVELMRQWDVKHQDASPFDRKRKQIEYRQAVAELEAAGLITPET